MSTRNDNELELFNFFNGAKCKFCGERFPFDNDVLEIRFKCEHCDAINVWRKSGLWIHDINDTEEGQNSEEVVLMLILIGLPLVATLMTVAFDPDKAPLLIPLFIFIIVFVVAKIIDTKATAREKTCISCGQEDAMEKIALARTRSSIRRIDRCEECGYQHVEDLSPDTNTQPG